MMTKEDKELLLKYLCANQQYDLKICVDNYNLFIPRLKYIEGYICHFHECAWTKYIDEIKPYLRPIYSIEEKEIKQIYEKARPYIIKSIKESELEIPNRVIEITNDFMSSSVIIDELNKRHIDYLGFIEKGIALEAFECMYKL